MSNNYDNGSMPKTWSVLLQEAVNSWFIEVGSSLGYSFWDRPRVIAILELQEDTNDADYVTQMAHAWVLAWEFSIWKCDLKDSITKIYGEDWFNILKSKGIINQIFYEVEISMFEEFNGLKNVGLDFYRFITAANYVEQAVYENLDPKDIVFNETGERNQKVIMAILTKLKDEKKLVYAPSDVEEEFFRMLRGFKKFVRLEFFFKKGKKPSFADIEATPNLNFVGYTPKKTAVMGTLYLIDFLLKFHDPQDYVSLTTQQISKQVLSSSEESMSYDTEIDSSGDGSNLEGGSPGPTKNV